MAVLGVQLADGKLFVAHLPNVENFPAPLHGLLHDVISGIPKGIPCDHLNSDVLEPSWLAHAAKAQHNTENREMVWLMAHGRGHDPHFALHSVHGVDLLYRVPDHHPEQLILPKDLGFC